MFQKKLDKTDRRKSYLERRIVQVLETPNFSSPESIELFRYFQRKLLELSRGTRCSIRPSLNIGEKIKTIFEKRLAEVLESQHYKLEQGMTIVTAPGFEQGFLGYSFQLRIESVHEEKNDCICLFSLCDKDKDQDFRGVVSIDLSRGCVKIDFLNNNSIKTAQEVQVMIGLTYLMRRPDYKNKPYQGNRLPNNSDSWRQDYGIDVGKDKVHTVFPFRRRTLLPGDNVWDQALALVDSIEPAKLAEIGIKNRSDIEFNVHYLNFSKPEDDNARYSRTFDESISSAGKISECPFKEDAICELVNQALRKGQRAVISIKGSWIPPELEERGAGKEKKPHYRRTVRKLILVAGGQEHAKIKELFNRKQRGENLDEKEERKLESFLKQHELDTEIHKMDKPSIHFADGSFSKTDNRKEKKPYIIRPKKM